MARTGWGRHTVVATGSNDSTKQVSVNAWNNDLDTDGLLGFTKQAGTISGGAIIPTGSVIEVQADGTLDELTPTNNNEFDLLYLIAKSTATSVTIDHDTSGGAGKIRLLSGDDETLSTTTPMILMCRTISSVKEWVQYGGGIVNALDDIGDVVITDVGNEDVLAYDSTTSKWINQTADESGRVTADSTTTFENKSIDLTDNTLTGSVAEFNTALQSESFATLGGTETLVSKTLTSPIVNTQITGTAVLDSDTMSGASATTISTSESIKAYVDTEVATIPVGDITEVTAGTGLSGGGTSGAVSLAVDSTIATIASPTFTGTVVLPNVPAIVTTQLNLKAPLASPTFTGTVAIPNYTNVETTLDGIATNATAVALRAPIASPTFTGTVVLPNVPAIVTTQLDLKAALAGPTFTGTVTADNITATGTVTCDVTGDVSGSAATATTAAGLSAQLVVASGGTNLTSYTAGDILYASGTTTLAKLNVGSNTNVLTLAGGVPTWAAAASSADTPWGVVHNFADYYYDMEVQTKPADPAADHGRFYVKEVDSDNDGVFCLIRKNGGFEETQIV